MKTGLLRHHSQELLGARLFRMCVFQLTLVGLSTDLKTCLKWDLNDFMHPHV